MSSKIFPIFLAAALIFPLWLTETAEAAFSDQTLLRDKAPGAELEQTARALSGGND